MPRLRADSIKRYSLFNKDLKVVQSPAAYRYKNLIKDTEEEIKASSSAKRSYR